jgi:hypothetical protein
MSLASKLTINGEISRNIATLHFLQEKLLNNQGNTETNKKENKEIEQKPIE